MNISNIYIYNMNISYIQYIYIYPKYIIWIYRVYNIYIYILIYINILILYIYFNIKIKYYIGWIVSYTHIYICICICIIYCKWYYIYIYTPHNIIFYIVNDIIYIYTLYNILYIHYIHYIYIIYVYVKYMYDKWYVSRDSLDLWGRTLGINQCHRWLLSMIWVQVLFVYRPMWRYVEMLMNQQLIGQFEWCVTLRDKFRTPLGMTVNKVHSSSCSSTSITLFPTSSGQAMLKKHIQRDMSMGLSNKEAYPPQTWQV